MVNTKQGESGVKHIKKKINPSRKGDMAEYYAVTWLWDQGYEVFQNSGCSGPVDMLVMDNKGDITLIDVKTAHVYDEKKPVHLKHIRNEKQIKLGVKILAFNPVTRKLKFVEHEDV